MNRMLTQTLDASVDPEARTAFESLVRSVRDATDSEPKLQRAGDALVLLAADAFNPRHDDAKRERRWRRLMRVMAPVAKATLSPELLQVVRENKDLLIA
ncbi:MAG: hypothetical protein JO322_05600 [Candidatus Eremiobacteraeota bacterium]|nr:hypothetical protein [Candidatus Eremiobacteraeota bacterium]